MTINNNNYKNLKKVQKEEKVIQFQNWIFGRTVACHSWKATLFVYIIYIIRTKI